MRWKATVYEWILFAFVMGISAAKLAGLFVYKNLLLPGWDTVPHFYLFRKFLSLLGSAEINGYDIAQLGGTSLFHFYGPLPFFLGAMIKYIGGSGMTDFFAWRVLLFLVVISFIPAFWFFTRTFVGKRMGWLSLALSLLYIFYPPVFQGFGIGASAVLSGGLFTSSLGIVFSLLFFSCLQTFKETGKKRWSILSVLSFSAIILSSPMVAVFSLLLWIIYAYSTREERSWIAVQALMMAWSFLVSLFFITPILLFHAYQSAHPQIFLGASGLITGLLAPFITVFAQASLDLPLVSLFLATLIISVFFVFGIFNIAKEKKYRIVWRLFSSIVILQIMSPVLGSIFPIISVHYYRSSPFILLFYLAIAMIGTREAFKRGRMGKIGRKGIVALLGIFVVSSGVWVLGLRLDRKTTFYLPTIDPLQNASIAPYHLNPENYPDYGLAREVIQKVKEEHPQRVFVEGDEYQIYRLGSPSYIATGLNLEGVSTINGLLNESSHQSDFFVPLTHGISHGLLWGYGNDSLIYNFDLITQFKENTDRLRLFGVDYIVAHSVDAIERLNLLLGKGVEEVARIGKEERAVPPGFQYALLGYRVYKFTDPVPLVYAPKVPVGLFIDPSLGNDGRFKDLSLRLFENKQLYNARVAFSKTETLSSSELSAFDYFLLSPKVSKNKVFVKTLESLEKPVITYNGFDGHLQSFLLSINVPKGRVSYASIREMNGNAITFEENENSPTPWVINLGMFPDWKSDRTVFEVTPGAMLLVSKSPETITLRFTKSLPEKISNVISVFALLLLPGFALYIKKKWFPVRGRG